MTFDTRIHFPQSQGGPNPEAVSRGCGFLFDTLHESMRFHSIPTDTALSETRNDIKNYPALLKNLQTAATWLKGCDTGTVFMLGGDCSTDVAIIDKLNAMHGKGFGFIWIDAHADIHVPQGS
ncbi:MAG: arginase family protein, partial [Alphaproteobacteria bacterium]